MNKTELQQKIVDMEKQLAELKKELEKKDKGIWKPEENEQYWAIECDGDVTDYETDFSVFDELHFEIGNYFKTKAEAEKMANYLKYTNLLRKYVEGHSEPIYWESQNQRKYYIYYDYTENRICFESITTWRDLGQIYASSEQVLKEAIEFVGGENVVKKYIFGIEE